jgi:hypothetical protein
MVMTKNRCIVSVLPFHLPFWTRQPVFYSIGIILRNCLLEGGRSLNVSKRQYEGYLFLL